MNIKNILKSIILEYPKDLIQGQMIAVDRTAYNISLVVKRKGRDITIIDIAGGRGLFALGCAALGMKSILVDDFTDEANQQFRPSGLEIHKSYGVEVICKDVIKERIELAPQSIDVVTSFQSMEHWHHSPKRLFHSLKAAMKPNGLFILSTANRVNLKKRLIVPFGYGEWSKMEDWYEKEIFRGHMREPDVDDLIYIAKDMGLKEVEILGRNWSGFLRSSRITRFCATMFDRILRLRPSFCSSIYLIGSI